MIKPWNSLPEDMKLPELKPYYRSLYKKRGSLLVKRGFDIMASLFLLLPAIPVMAGVAVWIKLDSKGPVFFRQKRVTRYGRIFRIHKFRTMTEGNKGSLVTVSGDARITGIGRVLRKYRLDELPQLFDVLDGSMSFVGTRPEVPEYVRKYTKEMRATLLLPAGITSETSIAYKDEEKLLAGADDPGEVYIKKVLPEKMKYNLKSLEEFSLINDMKTMFKTAEAVLK